MSLSKLFYKAERIVPFKRIFPVFVIMGLIIITLIIATIWHENKSNKKFYKIELIGKVEDIYKLQRSNSYKISGNWYLIKGEFINNIMINDSIIKKRNSYVLKIKNNKNNVKFEEEIKYLVFEDAGKGDIPILSNKSKKNGMYELGYSALKGRATGLAGGAMMAAMEQDTSVNTPNVCYSPKTGQQVKI